MNRTLALLLALIVGLMPLGMSHAGSSEQALLGEHSAPEPMAEQHQDSHCGQGLTDMADCNSVTCSACFAMTDEPTVIVTSRVVVSASTHPPAMIGHPLAETLFRPPRV